MMSKVDVLLNGVKDEDVHLELEDDDHHAVSSPLSFKVGMKRLELIC